MMLRSGVVNDTNKNDWYAPGHGDFYKVTKNCTIKVRGKKILYSPGIL